MKTVLIIFSVIFELSCGRVFVSLYLLGLFRLGNGPAHFLSRQCLLNKLFLVLNHSNSFNTIIYK